jgi:putative transposase
VNAASPLPPANQHDAIAAIELALTEAERLVAGRSLIETRPSKRPARSARSPSSPTFNGGPFRSARFATLIDDHPELHHVRIRARSPGQNGVRERGFGSLRSERRLYLEDIADVDELYSHAEGYLLEFNHVRPLCWNRPVDVHLGIADPTIPNFETARTLPTT